MSHVFRFTDEESDILDSIAKRAKVSFNDAVHAYLAASFQHVDLISVIGEINQELLLAKKMKEFKKLKSQFFSIANLQRTIYKIGMSNFFNSGEIDKDMISEIVEKTEEIIGLYPAPIQEKMKEQIKHIGKYKNPDHVRQLLQNFETLLIARRNK